MVQYNLKAKNIISSALGMDEYFRVSNCKNAKEMWDALQVTHEGTTNVKRSRINTLTHEYELFRINTLTHEYAKEIHTHSKSSCLIRKDISCRDLPSDGGMKKASRMGQW